VDDHGIEENRTDGNGTDVFDKIKIRFPIT